jgi:hypothetical protein
MPEKMGYRIAAIIFYELAGKCGLSAQKLEDIVYGALNKLDEGTGPGDWIELPSGRTFTKDKSSF